MAIVCLMGPTASGKTDLAIYLAQQFPVEIISVDSALVYKGLDIGTAKPTAEVLQQTPHHLIDIRKPDEAYSAACFVEDAQALIGNILKKDKIPLLVGGTMLYFRALQQGLATMPAADVSIRAQLENEGQIIGWPAMHAKLQAIDPQAAAKIHPHDAQRIQRAHEVYALTGKKLSEWQEVTQPMLQTFINIGIYPYDRKVLHERIQQRFKRMLQDGFLEEVKQLMQQPDLNLTLPAIRSVGYRQAWQHLQGDYDYATMVDKATAATRQLAKRQLTWLRHWPTPIQCFDSETSSLKQDVTTYLKKTLAD